MTKDAQKRALISVFDKAGIEDFAKGLVEEGYAILASGGTAKALMAAGVPVTDVAALVGGGAILGHRVVTLSREVHAGLLSTDSPEDVGELAALGIPRIDLVCVDLYPLEAEIAREGSTLASVIEKTDIGGPTMLRSGAKGRRIVVCDPADRAEVLERIKAGTADDPAFREALAAKTEYVIAGYVLASARYRGQGSYDGIVGAKAEDLCYGENKQQAHAALFMAPGAKDDAFALHTFKRIEGSAPSYINVTDLDRLVETATRTGAAFERNRGKVPFMAFAVKHGNCCGAAVGDDPHDVMRRLVSGDPEAISGGFMLCNFEVDAEAAAILRTYLMPPEAKRIMDGIIAPSLTPEAIDDLARKNGKCRVFTNPALAGNGLGVKSVSAARKWRPVRGGFLEQDNDAFILTLPEEWKKELSEEDQDNLMLGWGVGSTSNSNTVILTKERKLIGPGTGQRSRVMACKLALLYAETYGHDVHGAVAYSDSFFPFADGPQVLAKAGVSVIFATSGSIRDAEVKEAAEKAGVKLLTLPDQEARGFFGH